ncbi:MAG: hypothetical protein ABL971_05620 [Vicinamibacterales bacterium]
MEAPLPIVVGVTGHRDLRPADIPELAEIIRLELQDIQRRYPHSSLVLLSPLAEGADRLVAHVGLQVGMQLVVPFPFPLSHYEEDFQTDASRKEFADLLERASGTIHLPLLPGNTEESIRATGLPRDREYAKLGAFIASASQIVLALWDGVEGPGEKLGGTGQVVRFRLEGIPSEFDSRSSLTLPVPTGPVRHIVTPRQSGLLLNFLPFSRRTLRPVDRPEESFSRLLDRLELFNQDAGHLRVELDAAARQSTAQLVDTPLEALPEVLSKLPAACQRIVEQYAVADGLAVHFAKETLATLRRVFVGVGITALLFHLHAAFFHVPEHAPASIMEWFIGLPWLLIGFLACSAVTAVWLYGRAEKAEYQSKHQDYRALAEALRIQFFWWIAGLPDSVVDSFLRKQRSDLDWIRIALRTWHLLATMERRGEQSIATSHRDSFILLMHWISDQRAYFVFKARKEQAKLDREHVIGTTLLKLGAGGSAAIVLALLASSLPVIPYGAVVQHALAAPGVHHSLLIVIGMFGVSAALLRAYGDQLARSEHVRQFTRMSELFDAAEREMQKLAEGAGQGSLAALIRELGMEALEDSADWLILHRERPLELPHG